MKYFILTYEDNLDFALQTKYILSYDWDIDAEIIVGHKIDNEKYTISSVIIHNWVEFVLPKCLQSGDDCIIFEDDVRLGKSLDDLPFKQNDIVWFGYRGINHAHIVGTQGVYFNRQVLKNVYDNFKTRNPVQIDFALTKFIRRKDTQHLKIHIPKLSYCYEKEHISLISKQEDWIGKFTKNPWKDI
jgi:hypothetical protein